MAAVGGETGIARFRVLGLTLLAAVLAVGAPASVSAQVAPPPPRQTEPRTGTVTGQQAAQQSADSTASASSTVNSIAAASGGQATIETLRAWSGLTVEAIEFRGVSTKQLGALPSQLDLQAGQKLNELSVRSSVRRLYASGLYRNIDVLGVRNGDRVTIIFSGSERLFLGTVTVTGIKSDRLASRLLRSTKLSAGTVATQEKLRQADALVRGVLQDSGYYEAKVTRTTEDQPQNLQMNVQYQVDLGKQAKVGGVNLQGDSGMSLDEFRKKGKLKAGSKVTHDTVSRALTGLNKDYQKKGRLEANVALESKKYQPPSHLLDYAFSANQGPIVTVQIVGAKLSKSATRRLIPIYEEGAVDSDLLNEGARNLHDYYQRKGYFDVHVTQEEKNLGTGVAEVTFTVDLGPRHRVSTVKVAGNKYFDSDTIIERLSVHEASFGDRTGQYSQALVSGDVDAISALYQSNGFTHIKVTPQIVDSDTAPEGRKLKLADLSVKYQIDEGQQQRIGKFEITGTSKVKLETLTPLLNTQSGQPYSARNVTGDRDAVLGYYLSHGFDHVQVEMRQKDDPQDASLINVAMQITEGEQIFVDRVLISGLHYTRPESIRDRILMHPGDALNQSALLNTQRRLYDMALFNEVVAAVQNPDGDNLRKNVLLQLTEAKRWDINYGFGFEVQTGNPDRNCLSVAQLIQLGINVNGYSCNPNGKTGASPKLLFDVTRINFRGRNQSITLRTAYGTLEQSATAIFQNPRFFGNPKFDLSLSGGYTNSQDVTTYAASRTEGTVRVTHHPGRPNTLIYLFSYRLVKVDPATIQVAPDEIPLYAEPARIGGPGVTWLRDTRDNPLDAHRGTYFSAQEFFAYSSFGSQADFNRVDLTQSSYHSFGKKRLVIARNTRMGYQRSFGADKYEFIPLPERLYAGGAQSHRGFGINAAGPRDPSTGYPVGGAGAFVNSIEARFPNPVLPYVGNSLGFVLFHDMGNVFATSSDIWSSFFRFNQPHKDGCIPKPVRQPDGSIIYTSNCDYNYFSHAVGLGLRYHTPIGPVRADFSYNLNPPYYPVVYEYDNSAAVPHRGRAEHFNFFFSIGQSF